MAQERFQGKVILDNAILGELKRAVKKLSPTLTSAASEVDTSWDLPADAIVRDVFIQVNTAEATGTTKTIDIGLLSSESGGDADGFADGISVAAAGEFRPGFTTSDGGTSTFLQSNTRGVLLSKFVAGSDEGSIPGLYAEIPHLGDSVTAKSVSVTAGSSDFAELDVDIYVVYDEILDLTTG